LVWLASNQARSVATVVIPVPKILSVISFLKAILIIPAAAEPR